MGKFLKGHTIRGYTYPKGHIPWNRIEPQLQPTINLAYVLGVLKGDGFVSINKAKQRYLVRLATRTRKFNYSFEVALKAIGLKPHTFCYTVEGKPMWETYAFSKVFAEWYASLTLNDVEKLLSTPSLKIAFIRGFYESEGSLWKMKYGWQITMCNSDKNLIELVLKMLKDLNYHFGFGSYSQQGKGTKTMYRVYKVARVEVSRFIREVSPCIKNEIILNS